MNRALLSLGIMLLATASARAVPPGPGAHFDCSDTPTATSCAVDDPGCVPDSPDHLACGDALGKALAKAIRAVASCHRKQADARAKGLSDTTAGTAEDACSVSGQGKSAKEKLDAAIAKIQGRCSADQLAAVADEEARLFGGRSDPASLDARNALVYCDSTSGAELLDGTGDDTGWVPRGKPALACADTVGSELGKLVAAVTVCHRKMADAFAKHKPFDEDACEELDPVRHKAALEKYAAAMGKLDAKGVCTQSCLDRPHRDALAANALALAEALNAVAYPCPTPSCPNECGAAALTFTTALSTGSCGVLSDASGAITSKRCTGDETPCTQNSDCPSHACVDGGLACGGLYFGGGGVSVPLPATIPDLTTAVVKITACDDTTGALTLGATTAADTGTNRDCTSAHCFFGAPLPMPNASTPAISTCVVNTVAADAHGSGNVCGGNAQIDLPLSFAIFLTGDLLNGTAGNPNVPGIQPCPLCTGGTPGVAASGQCQGGPNNGLACTPADTGPPGSADFPTSQDCPPPPAFNLGSVSLELSLTTGTAHKTGATIGPENGRTNMFCGFCSHAVTGVQAGPPPVPCTSDIDCTTPPFTRCRQHDSGAFGLPSARSIVEFGAAGGDLSDDAAHPATLAGVFCNPPTFNQLVDGAADLGGPGAIAVQGTAQLRATLP